MNNQWFYIRQWKLSAHQQLQKHRTIRVSWKYSEIEDRETRPIFVKIPTEVELTTEAIDNYLSTTFGWGVASWAVSKRSENETRV